jgi:hypothetical protein
MDVDWAETDLDVRFPFTVDVWGIHEISFSYVEYIPDPDATGTVSLRGPGGVIDEFQIGSGSQRVTLLGYLQPESVYEFRFDAWGFDCEECYGTWLLFREFAYEVPSGVEAAGAGSDGRWRIFPNPARDRLRLSLSVPEPGEVGVTLFDPRGGGVLDLHESCPAGGVWEAHWELVGDGRRRLPAGAYLARISFNGRPLGTHGVVLLP